MSISPGCRPSRSFSWPRCWARRPARAMTTDPASPNHMHSLSRAPPRQRPSGASEVRGCKRGGNARHQHGESQQRCVSAGLAHTTVLHAFDSDTACVRVPCSSRRSLASPQPHTDASSTQGAARSSARSTRCSPPGLLLRPKKAREPRLSRFCSGPALMPHAALHESAQSRSKQERAGPRKRRHSMRACLRDAASASSSRRRIGSRHRYPVRTDTCPHACARTHAQGPTHACTRTRTRTRAADCRDTCLWRLETAETGAHVQGDSAGTPICHCVGCLVWG